VEDNLSWVLDSMANVNVACNSDLVIHIRATDVAGLRGIGGMTKFEEIGT
jgi:tRNA threonylcarbamoyladenosine modification (KEOPS) complex  Pcc1 subunit